MPDLAGYLALWSESHGGYDPARRFWPRVWLRLVYACAAPLARRAVPPDGLTVAGLGVSVLVPMLAALGPPGALVAVPLIVASGLVDSLDGAVAVLTGRASRFGSVLDSVCDRLAEVCYVLALLVLGAPGWLCVAAGGLAGLLEYVRARAIVAGMAEIGVVTVWERATRVVVTAFGLAGAAVAAVLLPGAGAGLAAGLTAGAWTVLGAIGVAQLLIVTRRRL